VSFWNHCSKIAAEGLLVLSDWLKQTFASLVHDIIAFSFSSDTVLDAAGGRVLEKREQPTRNREVNFSHISSHH
jgi:hypothetical protein